MGAPQLNIFKAIDFLLQVEKGPDAGRLYRIEPPKITVGRDPASCQIVLNDLKVSRQQFSLEFSDQVYIRDLSSRKTTLVNKLPVQNRQMVRPGDLIEFGDTQIRFNTRVNEKAQTQLGGAPGVPPNYQKQVNDKNQKIVRMILIGIISLAGLLFVLQEDPVEQTQKNLLTQEDVNKQIEESKERAAKIKESIIEKRKMSEQNYLQNVEQHFIRGFRDFQNGQYSRAIDSFGATIATDENHIRAIQYNKAAQKRRDDLIDTHMRDGAKYRDKMMYSRCAAEFDKALMLINDVSTPKYELARTQRNECDILKAGGRR